MASQQIGAQPHHGDLSYEMMGVVRDIKHHQLNEEPRPHAYFALLQFIASGRGGMTEGAAMSAGRLGVSPGLYSHG
jgi:hypothetical protein